MVARRPLPDEHHVMRYVPKSKQFIDHEGKSLGPAPSGFALRKDDNGHLSVTEIEHFGQMDRQARALAGAAYRASLSSKSLKNSAIFAWAVISEIKSSAVNYGIQVRVVHDPILGNPGHAEVRQFTDNDLDLLDYLATTVFADHELVATMDIPSL